MSSVLKNVLKVAGLVAAITPLFGLSWYFFDQNARAQTTQERVVEAEKKQETLEEVVKTLKEIHVRQDTVQQAEERMKQKLCAEGKLTGADCR